MKLSDLLEDFVSFPGSSLDLINTVPITGLTLDSRKVAKGNVFIALAGASQHGLVHVVQALDKGACTVVFDPAGEGRQLAGQISYVPIIAVDDLSLKLGDMASRYYDQPSKFMAVIGITGTNGKTSCSQFLSQMLNDCGIIGTLGWGEWGKLDKTLNTTPDALETQRILAELKKDNKKIVAMEVSSHGLEQGRVNGVTFKGAVFTNISRDHLDYHGTMEAYLQAKLKLLNKPGLEFAVVNLDDFYSDRIIAAVPESAVVWGTSVQGRMLGSCESVSADAVVHKADGIEFDVRWRQDSQRVKVPLYGDFNIENILTVLAVMLAMGVSMSEAVKKLHFITPVTGRMERFGGDGQPLIFVDYAHTPDALDKVLSSLRKHCEQALWVVFGCGGNRDKGKRPQMGHIAEQWADHVIVTDDNPRFENRLDIVKDILAGCTELIDQNSSGKIEVIEHREQAIHSAIARAGEQDCIVIAGKGHESYQDISGVQIAFNDSQVVIDALKMRTG
ncbi:UDP-N-acetylmuramoyl-L-alanyl-D-glutamate--2,6-diaminopimelate ligase [Methylobacter sp. S3L5C]|uniref:UDP-N-acetylmuramoyl-L-alanyl-D-glutamate--2, 6-diaminopimelate ligase n=1 Tax=Methylobacter sp. S3L5C TaxID=2839024 RepID=UPI001FAB3D11|nr:UDP-N-acetylmuramoyl-L-alanyl-D-glutamate--2,6-diaminopimelate ligase [Methylobacter sp. S3L5C]UOA10036.1 UDP-N-acetylmuramoyl-L-alanyl-D-glutamate--2,6-diaminopimelate ligase [Methylobacter sp. S3L5C]